MSKTSEIQKNTIILSLISGKGGVGKTSLIVSMGKVLALMGYKVLLVDSDLITHGMTFLLGFDSKTAGLLECYNNYKKYAWENYKDQEEKAAKIVDEFVEKFERGWTCKIGENLHFMQSTSIPSRKYSQQVSSESDVIAMFLERFLNWFRKSKEYDFILIDTQAGSVDTTRTTVSVSDKVVTVMEPDPVATYATENVIGELGDVLPRDSFYVINKLSVEEASAYEALENFLKILRHLPPVPFDFEVRRAFMVRQIPVDEKKPSAFLFGVIRMTRDLLPSVSEDLDRFEKALETKIILPIKEKMIVIEKELESSVSLGVDLKRRLEYLKEKKDARTRFFGQFFAFASGIVAFIALLVFLTLYSYSTVQFTQFTIAMIATICILLFVTGWTYRTRGRYSKTGEQEAEVLAKQLALLDETQHRMRNEYEAYRNLLITRSKELTLKLDKTD
jgi:cellulose biosynthesis protein BcsQ